MATNGKALPSCVPRLQSPRPRAWSITQIFNMCVLSTLLYFPEKEICRMKRIDYYTLGTGSALVVVVSWAAVGGAELD